MINRKHIEAILKVNGVPSTSPDEHIRSVLLSARYRKDEVDTAIMVLRQNIKTKQTRVDGLHKVFRTNHALSPEEISQLLGIDVEINSLTPLEEVRSASSTLQFMIVWILSVVVATSSILGYMYYNNFGPFHPSLQNERIQ